MVEIYTDGASRGNPGPSSYAYIIVDKGKIVEKGSGYLGIGTNNNAEYTAIIKALNKAKDKGYSEVELFSDSELVVRQIKGEYKVRSNKLLPLFKEVEELKKSFKSFSINHVRREEKYIPICDSMCNAVLDQKQNI